MKYVCGFAAVNKGKHCWINGECVVCHDPYPKVRTAQVGQRLMITDGVGPLRYVDLGRNTVHVYDGKKYNVNYAYKTIDNTK